MDFSNHQSQVCTQLSTMSNCWSGVGFYTNSAINAASQMLWHHKMITVLTSAHADRISPEHQPLQGKAPLTIQSAATLGSDGLL